MGALHFEKKMNKKIFRIILGSILLLVCVSILTFILLFHIREVEVVGNTRYTEKEIEQMALTGVFATNSFLISQFKGNQKTNDIPFLDGIKVEMVSHDKVRIIVNEKQVIGYVEYLDSDMFFDKDGLIVESAPVKSLDRDGVEVIKPEDVQTIKGEPVEDESTKEDKTTFHAAVTDVPLIEGLVFEKAVPGELLPVKNKKVFNTILGIARMVEKFQIQPDKVVFDKDYKITMYYGELQVSLGMDNLLEEKISRAAAILPKLTGKVGILHLEDYAEATVNIIFSEGLPQEAGEGAKTDSEDSEDAEVEDVDPDEERNSSGEGSEDSEDSSQDESIGVDDNWEKDADTQNEDSNQSDESLEDNDEEEDE